MKVHCAAVTCDAGKCTWFFNSGKCTMLANVPGFSRQSLPLSFASQQSQACFPCPSQSYLHHEYQPTSWSGLEPSTCDIPLLKIAEKNILENHKQKLKNTSVFTFVETILAIGQCLTAMHQLFGNGWWVMSVTKEVTSRWGSTKN